MSGPKVVRIVTREEKIEENSRSAIKLPQGLRRECEAIANGGGGDEKLGKSMKADNGEMVVEKILPVGAVEVLFVAEDELNMSRRPEIKVQPLKRSR
ncbi:MAG: hypothetical protein HQM08_00245 [Candidatus Riflebacteria bacterium]|nr:hypothetical protein [Candidatus Riflebacteria bacterium]